MQILHNTVSSLILGFNVSGKTSKKTVDSPPTKGEGRLYICWCEYVSLWVFSCTPAVSAHDLTFDQLQNEKLEEVLLKMKQEMHQMTKSGFFFTQISWQWFIMKSWMAFNIHFYFSFLQRKLNEQSAYLSKLENTLQHQRYSRVHTDLSSPSYAEYLLASDCSPNQTNLYFPKTQSFVRCFILLSLFSLLFITLHSHIIYAWSIRSPTACKRLRIYHLHCRL